MRESKLAMGASLIFVVGILLLTALPSSAHEEDMLTGYVVAFQSYTLDDNVWWDSSGTMHVRKQRQNMILEGDLSGRLIVFESMTEDAATAEAKCHGNLAFAGTIGPDPASGTGKFTGWCDAETGEDLCVFEYAWNIPGGEQIRILVARPHDGSALDWAYVGSRHLPSGRQ
ncbi:MAG: hypothetical protein OEM49_01095 [Myxococcales bacterium]|nr:hypothetical protein [Myxococcales bacterium]MDH5305824.1 hypothetical protein [Myxococcales bacterium]MDH5565969.1 hypothetical protein [Myxococcales bacterium]